MEHQKKILIADDSEDIREVLRVLLESEGYKVLEAVDGQDAVNRALEDPDIDLFILDITMPIKSGFKACLEIRNKSSAPILFLTAKNQDADKQMAFASGSDDYLSKPFSYVELTSRVKALLRRYHVYKGKEMFSVPEVIQVGSLSLSSSVNDVRRDDKEIMLTEIEYRILCLLASHRKKIFSAQNIYESVWNEPYFYTCNNTVMVHIRNLRNKIETDPQNPAVIKTVWGKGYRIE